MARRRRTRVCCSGAAGTFLDDPGRKSLLRHRHPTDEHDDVVDGERRPDDRYPAGDPRAFDDDGRYVDGPRTNQGMVRDDRGMVRTMDRDMVRDDRAMVRDDPRTMDRDMIRDDRGIVRDERWADDRRRTDIDTMPPPPARAEEVTTERTFSIGQLLILLAGAGLLALGIVAVVRGKLDGPLSEPIVEVLGFNHTSLLGLFEMGAGVLLLLAGLRPGRAHDRRAGRRTADRRWRADPRRARLDPAGARHRAVVRLGADRVWRADPHRGVRLPGQDPARHRDPLTHE
jgi:hypothetical protein